MMFLGWHTTKLLSGSRKNVTLALAKKWNFTKEVRHFAASYLLEEDVGINHFMSNFLGENGFDVEEKKKDLVCIFKYKCEDFHVYEIGKDKNILNLSYVRERVQRESGSYHASNEARDSLEEVDSDHKLKGKQKITIKKPASTQEGRDHDGCYRSPQPDGESNSQEEKNEWISFILYKVNKDTQEAIREISKSTNIPIKDFYYAGFKDKRSVSTQIISTRMMHIDKIRNMMRNGQSNDKRMKNIQICSLEKVHKKIELGAHSGNRFVVVLRNVQRHEDYLRHKLEQIKKHGFINYFGMQRFGVYKNTFNKGKALIRRDYKEYIGHVLDPLIFENKRFYGNATKDNLTIFLKRACDIYQKKNATFAFRYLSHKTNKLLKRSDAIPRDDLSKPASANKHLFSYLTNSEYEAYILLRNLYMCERNSRGRGKGGGGNSVDSGFTDRIDRTDHNDGGSKVNDLAEAENRKCLVDSALNDPGIMHTNVHEEENHFYKNEKTCVKGVSMETRRFHMHSYSAKIFNMLTSYRLENFGIAPGKGDYVFLKEMQSEGEEAKTQHKYIAVLYGRDESAEGCRTDGQMEDASIYNVVLPVLGSMPPRLSYLNVFKKLYRKYRGSQVRLVFLEILLYLMHTLHEDELFSVHGDNVATAFLQHLIKKEDKKNVNQSIRLASDNILNNAIPIKQALHTIKKFDQYVNSFEYEYGMTCVFRNVVTRPTHMYFCFCQYKEPKRKFLSDFYAASNSEKNENSKGKVHVRPCSETEVCKNGQIKGIPTSDSKHSEISLRRYQGEQKDKDKTGTYSHNVATGGYKNTSPKEKKENMNNEYFQSHTNNHSSSKEKMTKCEGNLGALILSFSLNSSSYATMLVRELYGKRNELLVYNLIKNCENYDKEVGMLGEMGKKQ
ncbi:tRNA pseudouridine synthase D, putative [Plasmodium knowlesi strain H]|uniref:tRNA pseudouridine synthase D, putative n=3 Tax=Plasmodium knowlesi TaxID=5850 RepID=A0A5K1V212_PLAKH|nr:tRNA pseudouridine synthase D, putative [Plasmodium knowlesi strain H]OTN66219.1 putative tRNA pseudouridine synthase D [Plasmodium knowlesi]CAA9986416.1 tRNA pseudouridine synthase D, putative [Plasmodium knowlesi strain H]SBO27180.1 tRNA pseudouridine synthase D, putative [Plasmodium knowlesi strain H]SBO29551.1 tRNA pseudouridine synthase D, putative [Plasmodium knowlesi strain H]VVS75890.1 tRNA pseudouridine synthase D, putative [Plasmodium knowlesi strain H]|eukprot:XP_002257822.1 hypothetical protein, conserved in Plasmodium species [Plasmodium knowlesi strain H]